MPAALLEARTGVGAEVAANTRRSPSVTERVEVPKVAAYKATQLARLINMPDTLGTTPLRTAPDGFPIVPETAVSVGGVRFSSNGKREGMEEIPTAQPPHLVEASLSDIVDIQNGRRPPTRHPSPQMGSFKAGVTQNTTEHGVHVGKLESADEPFVSAEDIAPGLNDKTTLTRKSVNGSSLLVPAALAMPQLERFEANEHQTGEQNDMRTKTEATTVFDATHNDYAIPDEFAGKYILLDPYYTRPLVEVVYGRSSSFIDQVIQDAAQEIVLNNQSMKENFLTARHILSKRAAISKVLNSKAETEQKIWPEVGLDQYQLTVKQGLENPKRLYYSMLAQAYTLPDRNSYPIENSLKAITKRVKVDLANGKEEYSVYMNAAKDVIVARWDAISTIGREKLELEAITKKSKTPRGEIAQRGTSVQKPPEDPNFFHIPDTHKQSVAHHEGTYAVSNYVNQGGTDAAREIEERQKTGRLDYEVFVLSLVEKERQQQHNKT